ncbi:hypothetical protein BX600DRAFT_460371 [Xylariales sp. PMI_506]|nr:hypothetical protein BX600DRAFT_460371 [Xylariales sp. PMI_506]
MSMGISLVGKKKKISYNPSSPTPMPSRQVQEHTEVLCYFDHLFGYVVSCRAL